MDSRDDHLVPFGEATTVTQLLGRTVKAASVERFTTCERLVLGLDDGRQIVVWAEASHEDAHLRIEARR